ncbi:MAG TPA: hypothetical protein VIH99_00560 [Bdellovibrionota bacterium]|jgi:3-hydroxymyristoyl/3-hydroxydecanoyl-(acyl carrier protein) dehydratase
MIQPSQVFDFTSFEQQGDLFCANWQAPETCPYFVGHFPDQPVLPAVGLLDGSIELIRRSGIPFQARKIALRKAKFMGMVRPGMKVRVTLKQKESSFEVEWCGLESLEPLASFSLRR